jgi:hypothetical protein
MRFQIRSDRNFTNSAMGQHEWFQPGVTFECSYPMKTGTLRVFPPDGRGKPIDVPVGLMKRID